MVPADKPATRVLLVDDEQDLVEFLSRRLLKRGYTVHATTNGKEALAAAAQQNFDVAIVDLKMPLMDGITVMKLLIAHTRLQLSKHLGSFCISFLKPTQLPSRLLADDGEAGRG